MGVNTFKHNAGKTYTPSFRPDEERHTDRPGDWAPNAKLTKLDVMDIKHFLKQKTYTQKQIADIFGVARTTITAIAAGKRWVNVQ